MTAGEVCNRQVVITRPGVSLIEAARLIKNYHVGDVIIVDETDGGRRPIGIVTDRDIALCVADRSKEIETLTAADVMSAGLVTSPEHQRLYDAVKRMQSHGIRRLPIVNEAGGLEAS
jgi:CBS domain-containing protein